MSITYNVSLNDPYQRFKGDHRLLVFRLLQVTAKRNHRYGVFRHKAKVLRKTKLHAEAMLRHKENESTSVIWRKRLRQQQRRISTNMSGS